MVRNVTGVEHPFRWEFVARKKFGGGGRGNVATLKLRAAMLDRVCGP